MKALHHGLFRASVLIVSSPFLAIVGLWVLLRAMVRGCTSGACGLTSLPEWTSQRRNWTVRMPSLSRHLAWLDWHAMPHLRGVRVVGCL
jgi:hypothetical protein